MPELKPPKLGTDKEKSLVNWTIQQTGSYLLGEFFNASYYQTCLNIADQMASEHRPKLTAIHAERKSSSIDLDGMIARLEDVSRWARVAREDDYHVVNSQVFVGLWSAQEAGTENIFAAILQSHREAAELACAQFKNNRYTVADWPWPQEKCLEIVQKLDQKAKDATERGGVNIAQRIATMFKWIGVDIALDADKSKTYNEASTVRNTILHRYGQLNAQDVAEFSVLAQWEGQVLHITTQRLHAYHDAVIDMHLRIARAIWGSKYF